MATDNGTIFSQEVCDKLKFYVYCLVDPRCGEIFYVGKGQNNRVFDRAFIKNEESETLATARNKRIGEIEKSGKNVGRYIICHGLDEDTAFTVESAVIGLLSSGISKSANPVNQIQGHHYSLCTPKSADGIIAMYGLPAINDKSFFTEDVLIVNISRSYGTVYNKVYDAARGYWRASLSKLQKHIGKHYVIAEYNHVFLDIFKPTAWGRVDGGDVYFDKDNSFKKGSKEYDELYEKYCNKRNGFYGPGNRSAFRYFGPWK